jgi:hypothetical protein
VNLVLPDATTSIAPDQPVDDAIVAQVAVKVANRLREVPQTIAKRFREVIWHVVVYRCERDLTTTITNDISAYPSILSTPTMP